ncbi:MAG TPA: UbiA family prenyltransferase [Candidatus Deferrimicrobium sp.]|nr:UbiA family prenyltransferase [Candidatus Deferrimicrobium sp.]
MKLVDLIFAARPMLHLPVWSIYLVALSHHHKLSGGRFGWSDLGMLACLSLMASGAYYLNQLYDYRSDAINNKLGFLQRRLVSTGSLMTGYVVTSVVAVSVSLLYSLVTLAIFVQLFLLGYIYSAPPIRLKDRPMWGLLANAYCFGFLVPTSVMPEVTLHNNGQLGWDNPMYFFLSLASIYALTTLADRDGDRAVGKRTLAVVIGPVRVRFLALLLMAGAAYVAVRSQHDLLLVLATLSATFILIAIVVRSSRMDLFATKTPILLLTLLAGFFYPSYLAFVIVTVATCRIYYRKRWHVDYPKLT